MNSVGEKIRSKRLSKNISINDVSNELCISKSIILNIEENKLLNDTDIVFSIGHLRSYCNYLELNSDEIINEFKDQISYKKNENMDIIKKPSFQKNVYSFQKFIPTALILIIFTSFYLLFMRNDQKSVEFALTPELPESFIPLIEKSEMDSHNSDIIDKTSNDFDKYNYSSANASIDTNISPNEDMITLKLLNPTWIQIRDKSDNIILSKLMEKDEEFSYKTISGYSITAGNAGNILVLINSEVRGKIGKYGEIVDAIIIDKSFNN